jgi:signal transduction histidine kinase
MPPNEQRKHKIIILIITNSVKYTEETPYATKIEIRLRQSAIH